MHFSSLWPQPTASLSFFVNFFDTGEMFRHLLNSITGLQRCTQKKNLFRKSNRVDDCSSVKQVNNECKNMNEASQDLSLWIMQVLSLMYYLHKEIMR